MLLLIRPFYNLPTTVVFVPSLMPGPVLRETENTLSAKSSPFTSLRPDVSLRSATSSIDVVLSGPPQYDANLLPWRVLFAETENGNEAAAMAVQDLLHRLGLRLSQKLGAPVYALDFYPNGLWRFIQWEAGTMAKTGGTATGADVPPVFPGWLSFLRRGSHRYLPPSLRVWARKNDLPLANILLGRSWKRTGRIIDYDAVAGLERKGLLVETAPVWYRVTINLPLDGPSGGIMEAP